MLVSSKICSVLGSLLATQDRGDAMAHDFTGRLPGVLMRLGVEVNESGLSHLTRYMAPSSPRRSPSTIGKRDKRLVVLLSTSQSSSSSSMNGSRSSIRRLALLRPGGRVMTCSPVARLISADGPDLALVDDLRCPPDGRESSCLAAGASIFWWAGGGSGQTPASSELISPDFSSEVL